MTGLVAMMVFGVTLHITGVGRMGKRQSTQGRGWSDDDILDALHMREQNYTMRQIGEHFGVTKNAVIGMVNRVMNESKD